MTAPTDDEHVSGSGAPLAELERREDRDDGMHVGAHARPLEVPTIEVPRHPPPDRPRYFLSSLEPSGEYDAVIVAVTDGERRRYFTTRDGEHLFEVDEYSFERRRESGVRSLLELDERELGELEAELKFVRPVRGRDPIAEAAADAEADEAAAQAEAEAEAAQAAADAAAAAAEADAEAAEEANEEADTEPLPAPRAAVAPAEPEAEPEAEAEAEAGAEPEAEAESEAEAEPDATNTNDEKDEDVDPVTEEFEEMVMASTMTSESVAAAASERSGDEPAVVAEPSLLPIPSVESMSATDAIAQVSLAKGISFIAHRRRLDKSGAPYIDHPGRIAERFDPVTEPIEAAAAWLHDVLEDTPVTAQELLEAGLMPEIVDVVQVLTRTSEISVDEYYARIRRDPVARRVKLADIDDNTARWRLRRLEYETQLRLVEKYRYARQALGTD